MYPTLGEIFGLPIRSYGLMLVIGFLLGTLRAYRVARRYHYDPNTIVDIALITLGCGLIGARVAFILTNWSLFAGNWAGMFQIWSGGLSFHGGLAAGLLGGMAYAKRRNVSFWDGVDMFSPSVVIGYAITRIGCFFNGCCYGVVCSLPWAVRFPNERIPGTLTEPSHPTQLYATVVNVAIFYALTRIEAGRRFKGQVFAWFLILHGVYRFGLEFLRAGATSGYLWGWVTDGHIVAVLMVTIGGFIYWRRSSVRLPAPREVVQT